jgi:hypothetical protein
MCEHVGKVVTWGVDANADLKPTLYGCVNCDETSHTPLIGIEEQNEHQHTSYVDDCFQCKIATLQFDTGDANSGLVSNGFTKKKWNNELKAYADARAQGIQPSGTSMKKVQAAVAASDKIGQAYKAG